MSAWTVIGHTEVGSGGAANITFSSIPATYTDLLITISGRSNHSGSFADIRVGPNGSLSNLSVRRLLGTGSAASSDTSTSDTGVGNAGATTSNTFSNMQIYIPNYTSSNAKSMSVDSVSENNATASYQTLAAVLWNPSPQAAITSIALTWSSGNFVEFSSATLYGITKGSSGGVTVS